jgi:fatty acid desaturase
MNLEDFYKNGKGDAIGWAIIFIWAAIVYGLGLSGFTDSYSWWNGWSVFFTGFGVIVIIQSIMHIIANQQNKAIGGFIFGFILIVIGLGGIVDTSWAWFIFLIMIAALILIGVFTHKK